MRFMHWCITMGSDISPQNCPSCVKSVSPTTAVFFVSTTLGHQGRSVGGAGVLVITELEMGAGQFQDWVTK